MWMVFAGLMMVATAIMITGSQIAVELGQLREVLEDYVYEDDPGEGDSEEE